MLSQGLDQGLVENEAKKKSIDLLSVDIINQSTEQDADVLKERLATVNGRWDVVKNEISERSSRYAFNNIKYAIISNVYCSIPHYGINFQFCYWHLKILLVKFSGDCAPPLRQNYNYSFYLTFSCKPR